MDLFQPLFVFDLDATITKCELLPLLAREIGLERQMSLETERAMREAIPFAENFRQRVELLKGIPVSRAREIIRNAPVHEKIVEFLRAHSQRCLIVTGNVDVWISDLLERLGMRGRCLCSKGEVRNDALQKLSFVMDKEQLVKELPHPFIAIGDGSNDIPLLKEADIGIGFSGVHPLTEAVRMSADVRVGDETELCTLLRRFSQ